MNFIKKYSIKFVACSLLLSLVYCSNFANAQPPQGSDLWQPIEALPPLRVGQSILSPVVYSAFAETTQYYSPQQVTLNSGEFAIWVGEKLSSSNNASLIQHINTNQAFVAANGEIYSEALPYISNYPYNVSEPTQVYLNDQLTSFSCFDDGVDITGQNQFFSLQTCGIANGKLAVISGTNYDCNTGTYFLDEDKDSYYSFDFLPEFEGCLTLLFTEEEMKLSQTPFNDQQVMDVIVPTLLVQESTLPPIINHAQLVQPPATIWDHGIVYDPVTDSYPLFSSNTTIVNNSYDANPVSIFVTTMEVGTGNGAGENNGGGDPNGDSGGGGGEPGDIDLTGVINAINSASQANSAKLDELINDSPGDVVYTDPQTITIESVHNSFYSTLNSSPLITSFNSLSTGFSTSNSVCPILSIDLTSTLINQEVSSDLHCVVFNDIAPVLSLMALAVYTLLGFRILAGA